MNRRMKKQLRRESVHPGAKIVAPRKETKVPVAGTNGWAGRGQGRAGHVDGGQQYLGTTNQVAGLFPFVQANGLPPTGVPLGRDLLTNELVCLDPPGWVGTMTANPGVWIQASPGVGKSACAKRLMIGLAALGYRALNPGDAKGEYSTVARALDGQVIRIGRGLDRINPLDAGPLGRALPRLDEAARETLTVEIAARRSELLIALLSGPNGLDRRPDAAERYALEAAVRIVTAAHAGGADPVIPDVIALLRNPPESLCTALQVPDRAEAWKVTGQVVFGLENLCSGPLAGLFDGPTSVRLDLDARAISVDLSALLPAGDHVVAAGMMAGWAYTYGTLDAAAALGLDNRPMVVCLDELWRALRAGTGMVDSFDALTRLNRAKGAVTMMITHSLRDLEALPNPADRAKAAGLMERCDTVLLGASSPKELAAVAERRPLTGEEMRLVASWAAPTGTAVEGLDTPHPGRGKLLVKIGHRLGVPTQMMLTEAELVRYETDAAIRRRPAAPR
ncbi:MAG: ATP-binding protein [Sporichthyaceae bacterium]